jgi:predicted nucleic acid-binding protein
VPELHTDKALLLRNDFVNGLIDLLAPDFFTIEIAHALTKAERQKRINPAEGGTLWLDIMTTCPLLQPATPLVPRAYEIASSARIGIYDCIYVALAEQEGCDLVTADDKLIRNLQPQFPFIKHLAALP